MNGISRKLRDLETNNLAPNHIEEGSTRLSPYCMTEAEREIHNRACDILKAQKAKAEEYLNILKQNPDADLDVSQLSISPDQQIIVDKSTQLYTERVMELFDNGIAQFIHLNDPFNKSIFYMRFNWFLKDMQEWLFLRWREDQVMASPGFFELCEGEQNRRLAPVYAEWRHDVLTKESWERFYEEHKPRFREVTLEQEAEDIRQIEKGNADAEAKDKQILAEKCPICTGKCDWYLAR